MAYMTNRCRYSTRRYFFDDGRMTYWTTQRRNTTPTDKFKQKQLIATASTRESGKRFPISVFIFRFPFFVYGKNRNRKTFSVTLKMEKENWKRKRFLCPFSPCRFCLPFCIFFLGKNGEKKNEKQKTSSAFPFLFFIFLFLFPVSFSGKRKQNRKMESENVSHCPFSVLRYSVSKILKKTKTINWKRKTFSFKRKTKHFPFSFFRKTGNPCKILTGTFLTINHAVSCTKYP